MPDDVIAFPIKMSASDDDDYLADLDKFLVPPPASKSSSTTYSQRRKEAEKRSAAKNEQNRMKGRRQRELESRTEGLSKSLFERAKEEEEAGLTGNSKALSMMMKMGFKPGQALGQQIDVPPSPTSSSVAAGSSAPTPATGSSSGHKSEPLKIKEWAGKKGIGLGQKRPPSPLSAERMAKMAKMAEASDHNDFRDRARREYEERRAEGRLGPAQRTCVTLDDKMGKTFSVLWLDPRNPGSFPSGLLEALELNTTLPISGGEQQDGDDEGPLCCSETTRAAEARLRRKMAAESLQPLAALEDDVDPTASEPIQFSPEQLAEAAQFLRLQASDRLKIVLSYLRTSYSYCFWCGCQYENAEDLASSCPGEDEDAHD
ncbi:unnamed protein product [Mycena citricolor]|uniref:G-patch domain-containing protein n=1 Tax=Mycena citricolor TaxID=2018698 RepID=A0AAD2HFE0_9AGAR|nr:unnamed protein product [Mycena citricolor]